MSHRLVFCLPAMVVLAAGCADSGHQAVGRDYSQEQFSVDQTSNPPVAAARRAARPEGYWPHWRGAQGDGVSRETGWSANWTAAGPPVVWKANVGVGFSSVSLAKGRLYTMGHRGGQDTVYCLDAVTGAVKWTYSYTCRLFDHLHEGGPGATPTIDGDRIYTLSREGHLFCFDAADGRLHWSKQLADELQIQHPEWGFTSSPLVLGEKLILDVGPTVALDKQSGQVLWQTSKYRPGYGSPVAFHHNGRHLIAVLNNDRLMVIQAEDGEQAAHFSWRTDYATTSTTPIVDQDVIFISSGYNRGCALLRLSDDRLDPVYQNREMRNHFNNSVLWRGRLYGFDGNSHLSRTVKLVCMEYSTGKVKWSERGYGCGSVLIADGKLIILSDDGYLATAEASPERFREISRIKVVDGRCWTVPVLAGHRIYCRSAVGDLVCVDVGAGW